MTRSISHSMNLRDILVFTGLCPVPHIYLTSVEKVNKVYTGQIIGGCGEREKDVKIWGRLRGRLSIGPWKNQDKTGQTVLTDVIKENGKRGNEVVIFTQLLEK